MLTQRDPLSVNDQCCAASETSQVLGACNLFELKVSVNC